MKGFRLWRGLSAQQAPAELSVRDGRPAPVRGKLPGGQRQAGLPGIAPVQPGRRAGTGVVHHGQHPGPVATQQQAKRRPGRCSAQTRTAGLFRDAADGSPVCVTATLFDGLVLGRSARNHSMNYRSVTIHGSARPVIEPEQIIAGLRAVVDHITPGRWEQVRKPAPAELREIALWQVAIDNASVKARAGSTLDPDADRALEVWAGHIPAWLTFGQPVEAEGVPPGTELPGYLRALSPRRQLAG
jgi:hypothetical protein